MGKFIAVIDYGLGNLKSVSKALESAGAKVVLTSNPDDLTRAKAVVLPGVGAFSQGMKNLEERGLISGIKKEIKKGKPFLGICVGLQVLFSESEEHGISKGFDLIEGRVARFKGNVKIPHMGWNQVRFKESKLFKGIPQNSYFYFVHSYYVEPKDRDVVVGTTEYGKEFCSVIAKDNIYGVQFHPEKSSDLGLRILKNFCKEYYFRK